MLHALAYSLIGSDAAYDLIYVGYLGFMCGLLILTNYLDSQRALRRHPRERAAVS